MKVLLYIVGFFLCLALLFSIINVYKYKKDNLILTKKGSYLIEKNEYLKRCLTYQSHIDNRKLTKKTSKEVIFYIYYTGESCSICAESLMKILKTKVDDYSDKIKVLIDDPNKRDLVINYNDAYLSSFTYNVETVKPLDEVLLIKVKDMQVDYILEYKPEQQQFFEEYFDYFENE